MAIIVGIDGTGSAFTPGASRDAEYDIAFRNSFVSRICKPEGPNKKYFRGPVALGGGLVDAVNAGHQFVLSRRRAGIRENVLLTGYSRGAAGVVAMAKKLKDSNVPVRALLMFDCVDRHLFIDADVVPNNVGYVMHVIRDSASSSRESFGNDGMSFSPPTVYPAAYKFMCTHGGMGGCPWARGSGVAASAMINEGGYDGATNISYAEDERVSGEVWAYVQPFMRDHGYI